MWNCICMMGRQLEVEVDSLDHFHALHEEWSPSRVWLGAGEREEDPSGVQMLKFYLLVSPRGSQVSNNVLPWIRIYSSTCGNCCFASLWCELQRCHRDEPLSWHRCSPSISSASLLYGRINMSIRWINMSKAMSRYICYLWNCSWIHFQTQCRQAKQRYKPRYHFDPLDATPICFGLTWHKRAWHTACIKSSAVSRFKFLF